jgi:hypothetical protein
LMGNAVSFKPLDGVPAGAAFLIDIDFEHRRRIAARCG